MAVTQRVLWATKKAKSKIGRDIRVTKASTKIPITVKKRRGWETLAGSMGKRLTAEPWEEESSPPSLMSLQCQRMGTKRGT